MKEKWATRESQKSWFLRMTHRVVNNTKQKILIIIFSDLWPEITDERIRTYEEKIPNSKVIYVDLEFWKTTEEDLLKVYSPIDKFIS
jgi:hypothetical protein